MNSNIFTRIEKNLGLKLSTFGELQNKVRPGTIISGVKVVNVILGFYSLKELNIPIWLTVRRCTIFYTILIDYLYASRAPTKQLMTAASLIILGALIAGYEDFHIDYRGYFLASLNNITSAFVYVATSVYDEKKVVNAFDLNFFFSVIGFPVTLVITVYNGDL